MQRIKARRLRSWPQSTLLFLVCALLCPHWIIAQTGTLVDVFPLAVGNQWTYDYYTWDREIFVGDIIYSDTGSAQFTVLSNVITADSTRWLIRERRDVVRCIQAYLSTGDTCYQVNDSTTFEIIEKHQDAHRLYRNTLDYELRFSVFPFTRDLSDTTFIYRYMRVDSTGRHAFQTRPSPDPYMQYTFVFRKNIGELSVNGLSFVIGSLIATRHQLLNSTIVAVESANHEKPRAFSLLQNYPNPFNATTTIKFQLPSAGKVSLRVYNIMGELVATVADDHFLAGDNIVVWDASTFASGVYFCRLEAGNIIQTQRVTLLK